MHRHSRLVAALGAVAIAATAFAPAVSGPPDGRGNRPGAPGCRDRVDAAAAFSVDVDGEVAEGLVAYPSRPPRDLVVFAHGYGHSSASWEGHLRWAAEELGAVAVAMDYRGTEQLPAPGQVGGTRGWQVREGAADSNTAALALLDGCPTVDQVTMFSVSMGGNTAGLAIAGQPVRADGAPLYDWWLNLEGAANVVETYLEARSLAASGNAFANNAVADIERENGGPIEAQPAAYVDLAVVTHAADIGASGLKGVWHVHGAEDGLVPYDQSRELQAALSGTGLAQEFVTMLRRDPDGANPDEDQTNASDYAVNVVDPTYESPLVGHGSERSAENDVMAAGLARLRALLGGDGIGCGEFVHDAGVLVGTSVPC